jgi:hypothetical protein
MPLRLTVATLMLDSETEMDAEQTIAEIERIERIFELPDARPLGPNDLAAANRRQPVVSPLAAVWRLLPI